MPRKATACLIEMREACEFLSDCASTMTFAEYRQSKMARFAVKRCFITLGEAVKQLNLHHPAIGSTFSERVGMIAFRNVIVHEYWSVDDEDVWSIIVAKVPLLKALIDQTIKSLP